MKTDFCLFGVFFFVFVFVGFLSISFLGLFFFSFSLSFFLLYLFSFCLFSFFFSTIHFPRPFFLYLNFEFYCLIKFLSHNLSVWFTLFFKTLIVLFTSSSTAIKLAVLFFYPSENISCNYCHWFDPWASVQNSFKIACCRSFLLWKDNIKIPNLRFITFRPFRNVKLLVNDQFELFLKPFNMTSVLSRVLSFSISCNSFLYLLP